MVAWGWGRSEGTQHVVLAAVFLAFAALLWVLGFRMHAIWPAIVAGLVGLHYLLGDDLVPT